MTGQLLSRAIGDPKAHGLRSLTKVSPVNDRDLKEDSHGRSYVLLYPSLVKLSPLFHFLLTEKEGSKDRDIVVIPTLPVREQIPQAHKMILKSILLNPPEVGDIDHLQCSVPCTIQRNSGSIEGMGMLPYTLSRSLEFPHLKGSFESYPGLLRRSV